MKHVKVSNFTSPNSYNKTANQFYIETSEGLYFQSYRSIIAFIPNNGGKIRLDEYYWDYSRTTGKYRNIFLGEGIVETRKKIEKGIYVLTNLN